MATNIRFNYFYRDLGNWKYFGWVDFQNPLNWSLVEAEHQIRQSLIDGVYFYPMKVGIPTLRFHDYFREKHIWYEFESLKWSDHYSDVEDRIDTFVFELVKNNRDLTSVDFMNYFHDDDLLNKLSPDDRIEIFSNILIGSSDFTAELLNSILSNYGVDNLIVKRIV
jgi:hypothetical protein